MSNAPLPARLRDAAEWVTGSTYMVLARQTSPEDGLLHYSTGQALARARPAEYVIERSHRERRIRRITRQEAAQRSGEPASSHVNAGEGDPLRPLSTEEAAVVDMLIADAEKMIADLTRDLDPDEQAVRDVQAARDWLLDVRDTRTITTADAAEVSDAVPYAAQAGPLSSLAEVEYPAPAAAVPQASPADRPRRASRHAPRQAPKASP